MAEINKPVENDFGIVFPFRKNAVREVKAANPSRSAAHYECCWAICVSYTCNRVVSILHSGQLYASVSTTVPRAELNGEDDEIRYRARKFARGCAIWSECNIDREIRVT